MHHPIFEAFARTAAYRNDQYDINFMGSRVQHSFELPVERLGIFESGRCGLKSDDPTLPANSGEDYLEWIDVCEAIARAEDEFVMIEAGAGYGRWLVNAAQAIRRYKNSKIKKMKLVGIEPDPSRFELMKKHFTDNDLDPDAHWLIQAGVSDEAKVLFLERKNFTYGEGIVHNPWEGFEEIEASAQTIDAPELVAEDGTVLARGIRCIKLSSVLEKLERVDLLDCDLQEEELRVVRESIDLLTARVKRLHIGTHTVPIEVGLRKILSDYGWKCLQDFTVGATQVQKTPYGDVQFIDGVQSWLNPRFDRTSS
jgi:FkbM family methyltransferase